MAPLRWCWPLLALAACGPVETEWTPDVASLRQAIIGGTVDSTDTNVFALVIAYFSTTDGTGTPIAEAVCSSTLIGTNSLLTAAHCTYPTPPVAPAGSQSLRIKVCNVTDLSTATGASFISALRADYDPSYDSTVENADIGMVLLPQPPGPTPKPWNTADISADTGQTMRVIGYGQTSSTDNSPPVRRLVNLPLESPISDRFQVGTGQGTCHGDSGGPSLLTGTDGLERVVGVHAYGPNDCSGAGEDMRVDANQAWINTWLGQYDPPVAFGQACTAGQTVCVTGAVCTGAVGAAPHCQQTCAVNTDCPSGDFCTQGTGSLMFCRKDPITLPDATPLLGAEPSGGCAAAGGGLAPIALLALALRRRRPVSGA
jgi:secreted trypsin-like serine protease